MRVLMLGPFPRSPETIDGGVAAAITYLSQELVSQPQIDLLGVRVAAPYASSSSQSSFAWPIIDLPLDRGSVSTYYLRQRLRFAKILRDYRPDIVHAQGADVSGLLAVKSSLPSVVTVHGLLAECSKYQTNVLVRARDRLQSLITELPTVRRARRLIAISPYVTNYYGNALSARIDEIPNAVPRKYFEIPRSPERGRLLFAGRISKGKGVLELVQAVAKSRVAATQLILAGSTPDPEYERNVRREVARSGISDCVHFVGLLNERALMTEFSRAEALVLPSFQETAPMVIQQAMASGLAVLATRVGGVPYQIEHGRSGMLFDPVNSEQLGVLLRKLNDDEQLGVQLGREAKIVATARFDATSVAAATRQVYESILGE